MKQFLFASILIFACTTVFSQKIIGNWQGDIEVNGQSIPIIFHFYKDSIGALNGKWDSPSQKAMNLPCSDVIVNGDSIMVGLKIISGFYAGKFLKNDSIAGVWHQRQGQLPLSISKTGIESFKLPARPQTPKSPFNYDLQDITYFNADHSIQYGATLTKPFPSAKNKKFPAVLLITGSGKQDRDENIFDHKPFVVIADYLTKKGIAVLRVDDRGMGKTAGNFDTSSSEDFAKDVEAGINYLKSNNNIDSKHIGLIGHSEGGMIAPMVASNDKDVAFIVMLAGTAVPGAVINDFQNVLSLKNSGVTDAGIRSYLELHHALVNVATTTENPEDYKSEISKTYLDWKKKQSPETVSVLVTGTDDQVIPTLQSKYSLFHSKWWKFFLIHDPAKDLEKLSIPVLALNGEKDVQVDPKVNLPVIESALKKSKSKNYKTIELPGLNHLFQHCKKCTIDEYGELEETFSPEALKIIGDWIESVVNK